MQTIKHKLIFLLLTFSLVFGCSEKHHPKRKDINIKKEVLYSPKTVSDSSFLEFTISGGTFDMDMHIIICSDIKRVNDSVNKNYYEVDTSFFDARGVTIGMPGSEPVMWLPRIPRTIEDISVVHHEVLHLAVYVLNWAGLKLSDETEELYGYMVQHIAKEFYENIQRSVKIN